MEDGEGPLWRAVRRQRMKGSEENRDLKIHTAENVQAGVSQ
jgi:hypothetical protein